jgi:adenylate cyclase
VETYDRATAADRAGIGVDLLDRIVALGILRPDAEDRLSDGDVRKLVVIQRLEAGGIPIGLIAEGQRSGDLPPLDFVDDPAYNVFAALTGETFQELSERTGIPMSLLMAIRESTGSAAPTASDRVREDELEIVPLIEFQLAHGFRPTTLERGLRVFGDSFRRIAEQTGDAWRAEVIEPFFAAGFDAGQLNEALADVSVGTTVFEPPALLAIYRGQQAHVFMANIIGGFETVLAMTGRRVRPEQPPAMCFLDITGYTRLTQERGDAAAADLATSLARLVERTSVRHGGRPIKWLGDGVMFFFKDPGPGVLAALEMVAGVSEAGLPPAHVGLHAGPVVFQEGDYYGQTVNVAARIADYARPGEVLVSQEVVDASQGSVLDFREIGPVELKGVAGTTHLYSAHRAG